MMNSHVSFYKKILMPKEIANVSPIRLTMKPEGLLKIFFKSYEDFCHTQTEHEVYYFDKNTKRTGFRLSKLLFETAHLLKRKNGWESLNQKFKTEILFRCGDLIGQPITDIDSLNLMNRTFEEKYIFPLRRFCNSGVSEKAFLPSHQIPVDYIEVWDIIPNYNDGYVPAIGNSGGRRIYEPSGNYYNVKIFYIWK